MALSFNVGLTPIDDADTTTDWTGFNRGSGGVPSAASETDIFIQGVAAVSAKISGSNTYKGIWYDATTGIDMTIEGRHLYIWVAVTTIGYMDILSAGGLFITVSSDVATADTNWNEYYVGGSDFTVDAGFVRYVIDLKRTPSNSSGSCDLTSVRSFGAGVNGTSGTIKSENLVIDRVDYGDGQLQVVGDGSTVATWDDFFTEDDIDTNKYGIIRKEGGVYFVKGRLTIGDAAQANTTTFIDTTGAVLVFEDPQYYETSIKSSIALTNAFYGVDSEGAFSNNTSITLGNVVGSGDDRQGVQGGTIQTAGPRWFLDFSTNIGDMSDVNLYGAAFKGATEGVSFDDGNKTILVSDTFVNCGEVTPGLSNSGAEMLACTVIDPLGLEGVTDGLNTGLEFPNVNHLVKQINFITSNPAGGTQYMAHLTAPCDYDIVFNAIKYFGDYSSATIWHALNSGGNLVLDNNLYTANLGQNIVNGGVIKRGQSFSPVGFTPVCGGNLMVREVEVSLSRLGSPTGPVTCSIFAHTGIYGEDSGIPTGSALSTSDPIESADIATAQTPYTFTFPTPVTLVGTTHYCMAVEFDGGSFLHWILVWGDSSELHSGTANQYISDWTADGSIIDNKFECRSFIKISATNDANPVASEVSSPAEGSLLYVSNDVTLSIEVVDTSDVAIENAQCAVYQTSDNAELMNEDTLASGFATQSFNYVSDVDIYFRVRKSSTGDTKYINLSGTGQVTTNGFNVKVTLREDTNA